MPNEEPQNLQSSDVATAPSLDLKYRGQVPIAVRGTVTGSLYHFSGTLPVRPVDLRDARFLLASRLFTIFP